MKPIPNNRVRQPGHPTLRLAAFPLFACLAFSGPGFAANLIVNTFDDELNADGDCSLREAITAANTNTQTDACPAGDGGSSDTITFAADGTVLLDSTLPEITDAAGLTIDGSGHSITVSGDNQVRVMEVAESGVLKLENLTVANGRPVIGSGGISNRGTLTVTNSTISNNTAVPDSDPSPISGFGSGGGIRNEGILIVTNSIFSNNTAGEFGGGIFNIGDVGLPTDLTVTNSTFYNNTAGRSGGGIYSDGLEVTVTLINSTFFNNTADGDGGGISNGGSTVTTVTNSTFYNNTVGGNGGGIFNDFGNVLNLANTILAGNAGGDCFAGAINPSGVNLIEDGSCDPNAITGDPLFDPAGLQDNGGPTMTIALCDGDSPAGCTGRSPAIDAVPAADCSLATDQRGEPRPVDGDGDFKADCDIGAYELQTAFFFPFEGFFAPVANPPTVNLAKAGRGIPVKFSLAGDRGLDIFQAGYPKAVQIGCDNGLPSDVVDETVTAGASGLQYDPDSDTYIYVWKTSKAWKGSCRRFSMKLIDGSEHSALFEFK